MVCSQRTTQGSSVYFTNSRDCCSILEKLDFSRSPTMWGGTRKIRAISLTWNFRVSKNCACSGEMPMGRSEERRVGKECGTRGSGAVIIQQSRRQRPLEQGKTKLVMANA